MSIVYDPTKLLQKIAPAKKLEKLVKGNLTLNKTALDFVDAVDFIDRKNVTKVALGVVKNYKDRVKAERAESGAADARDLKLELADDPKLLVQRVQNEVVLQISAGIKERYHGEFYKWLPSSASEPDPEHQLNYGETFQIGVGEQPGERYGCQCGMEILVDGDKLDL